MEAPLDRVKALLAALPREDQEDLTRFLHDILVSPEEADARHVASLMAEVRGKMVTYTFRQEYIRCGKKGCRCREGQRHGPYTYKYWREEGRLKKAYVGISGTRARTTRPGAAAEAGLARDSTAPSRSAPGSPASTRPGSPDRT